ncbi:MAG: GntR family transcriptional regulator [Clostridia bacterium]|nr:GntR family transcriptional regulator [Clostridia bacterium]
MIEARTISIAGQVYENLERDILSGKYEKGTLLTETKLSEELGVSRTPIREALRRLEQDHMVEIGKKGAEVLGISEDDIDVIYEVRCRIEGIASRLAAQNADPDDIEALRTTLELQEFFTAKGNAEKIKNEDNSFHKKIYELSGCTPLADTLLSLHKKVVKYRRVSLSNAGHSEEALAEHRAIFEAIAAKDADAAEKATFEHVNNARMRIREGRA